MEKKYYDLIAKLIREHKKFSGYESLFDEIVEEVYNKAKVVLDTVSNEDVISSYINKIIFTSIITVSKKMDFNPRISHKVITTAVFEPVKVETVLTEVKPLEEEFSGAVTELNAKESPLQEIVEEPSVLDSDSEVNDLMIEEAELDTETQELSLEVESNVELAESVAEESDLDVSEESELVEVYNDVQPDNIEIDNTVETMVSNNIAQIESVDKSLVDKMINGISEQVIQEEVVAENEALLIEENFESLDNLEVDITSEDDAPEIVAVSEEDVLLEEDLNESLEQNIDLSETMDSGLELVLEEAEELASLDKAVETDLLEDIGNSSFELVEEKVEPIDTAEKIEFIKPNYGKFSFVPEKSEFDYESLNAELENLNIKYPGRKLKELCKMKYIDRKSVAEIADTIGLSVDDVVENLNCIIGLVKD
ncbi:hypothetical protein IJD34_01570 [bacterium]|nr:hypothetical protein [bacterium]